MTELGLDVEQIRITGGGARSPFWRQLLADVFGRPIVRTIADEGPAYGAALLAGIAAGVFRNVDDACAVVQLRPEQCDPDTGRARLYDDCYAAYVSLYPATRTSMHELSGLAARDSAARPA
jgi:xylulokinase